MNKGQKRILQIIGHLISLASIVYLIRAIPSSTEPIKILEQLIQSWPTTAIILLILLSTQMAGVYTWYILWPQSHRPRFFTAFSILAKSQLARYLPGNIGQYISMAFLAKKSHLNLKYCILVSSIQLLASLFSASMIFLIFFLLQDQPIAEIATPDARLVSLCLILVSCLFFYYLKKIKLKIKKSAVGLSWSIATVDIVITGYALYLAQYAFGQTVTIGVWSMISAFAVAWAIGTITPGSPGGIGVREYIMLLLLNQHDSSLTLAALLLFFRILNIGTDLIFFISAYYVPQKPEKLPRLSMKIK